jgi:hypothetical protein
MLHYMIGGTFITMLGGNILNNLVSGTLDILYSSAAFIRYGSESNKTIQKIRIQIEEMDIKLKLELVQTLLQPGIESGTQSSISLMTKIIETGLIDIVYKIKSLLEYIDFEIDKHKLKWFAGYRSIVIDDKLAELQHYVNILNGRINMLIAINNQNQKIEGN